MAKNRKEAWNLFKNDPNSCSTQPWILKFPKIKKACADYRNGLLTDAEIKSRDMENKILAGDDDDDSTPSSGAKGGSKGGSKSDNTMLYVGAVVGIVVLGAIVFVIMKKRAASQTAA